MERNDGCTCPNGDWISADREGLTFCDATSAVFAYDMPWDKLDVTTWSWQKILGRRLHARHSFSLAGPAAESFTPENRPLLKFSN
ncbi:MAG: hypothetical protein R3D66_05250 [Alphaproteobacteria bacterium]